MKPEDKKSEILKWLTDRVKPATAGEIAGGITMHRSERKRLQKWLHEMVVNGDICRAGHDRFSIGPQDSIFTGHIEMMRSGDAILKGSTGEELLAIAEEDLNTAMPGDKVLARVVVDPGRKFRGKRGKVIRVVERIRHDIVGTLHSTGRFLHVVPLNRSYRHDFYVADAAGAKQGDRVVVRFVSWQDKHVNPEAEIIEIIGPEDNASLDTRAVIRQFGIRSEFSQEVLSEAETVSVLVDRPGEREDFRNHLIITIDPDRARDFDDALSLEKDHAGNQTLGVHIADVSHFVTPGSALDKEAYMRGNSTYFPDGVVPMLPEQLSNGVCSLKPDTDRLAFSAILKFDKDGRFLSRRFCKSIIRSSCRLTYEQVMEVFKKGAGRGAHKSVPSRVVTLLWGLTELAQQLRRRRFAAFALDLDIPEVEVLCGPDGTIQSIRLVETDISHQLVEECMVAANEAVATELRNEAIPVVFRIHDPPAPNRIEDLTNRLVAMGHRPGDLKNRKNLSDFLKSIKNDPLAYHLRVAVLRSLKRAIYSASPSHGHFGLAKRFYGHFTSPIRRYPDLALHRQLEGLLKRRAHASHAGISTQEQLSAISAQCTATELKSDEAEREVTEIKKYRYLQKDLESGKPQIHDAVVVNVTNFGVFVELTQIKIQGLIHVSALSDSYVRYDKGKEQMRAGREVYAVGTAMKVRVARVDMDNRRVDFSPA